MPDFTNKLCPVCHAAFTENADIVVCPECGTPHHRVCYLAKNKCAFEALHEKGYVWDGHLPDEQNDEQNPEQPAAEQAASAVPVENPDPHHADYPAGAPQPKPRITIRPPEEFETAEEYYRQFEHIYSDDTRGDDGVSLRELCAFATKSIIHYGNAFTVFRGDTTGRKSSVFVNFCSGLFLPVHQFYRKMDLLGVIVLALCVMFSLPELLFGGGIIDITQLGASAQALVSLSYYLCNMLEISLMVILTMFGDFFYYKHAVYKIKKIRLRFGENLGDEYYAALSESGSPSALRAVVGFLLFALAVACVRVLPMILLNQSV